MVCAEHGREFVLFPYRHGMKNILLLLVSFLFGGQVFAQYGHVDPKTNEYTFTASLVDQYMFYGYAEPDKRSKKLILFSAYPTNISTNRLYTYPIGAFNETTGIKDGEKIIYTGSTKHYARMKYIDINNKETVFYIGKRYVRASF